MTEFVAEEKQMRTQETIMVVEDEPEVRSFLG